MRENAFKAALREGRQTIGVWSNLTDPVAVEICASAGFDWILIDNEHSPADVRTTLTGLQAAAAHPTSVLVRPAFGDAVTIKRLLDIGTQTLLVPMVDTAEHARELAAAVQFPPHGVRGVSSQTRGGNWGREPGYLTAARDEICLIAQIESATGLANIDEIAAVEGLDALFVGTADLAASMGHLGQPGHPDVAAAVDHVVAVARDAGLPLGTLTRDAEVARRSLDAGFAFVGVGTDTALFAAALDGLRRQFDQPGTRA